MEPAHVDPERGSLLITVMVALVVLSVLTASLMQMLQNGSLLALNVRQQQAITAAHFDALNLLRDRAICTLNFRGRSTAPTAPDYVTQVISDNASPPTVLLKETVNVEQDLAVIRDIRLADYQPYTTSGPDSLRGTMDLVIAFTPPREDAVLRLRRVLLAVELNPYPPANGGPADEIKSCVAIGVESETWNLARNGDIYHESGNVGVSVTDVSRANLQIAENVLAKDYFHPSDARLKTAIGPAHGLGAVARLRGVHYRWRSGGDSAYGVLAQNVERVFPEAVRTDPGTGLKSVDSDQLIGPLIESVNELARRNRALRARLANVRAR